MYYCISQDILLHYLSSSDITGFYYIFKSNLVHVFLHLQELFYHWLLLQPFSPIIFSLTRQL